MIFRKRQEQGLRNSEIKEFTFVNDYSQDEHNAVIDVF
jgi:hypothetical protein